MKNEETKKRKISSPIVGVRVARCESVCVSSISLLTNTTTEKREAEEEERKRH